MKDQFKEYLHAEAVRRDTRSARPLNPFQMQDERSVLS